MGIENNIWILVNPETLLLCENELELFLNKNGFTIIQKKESSNFYKIYYEIHKYFKKLPKPQIELFYKTYKNLLGKTSENCQVWLLGDDDSNTVLVSYERLNKLKRVFRRKQWDADFDVLVKSDMVEDNFCYSYLHVSDANDELIREESELINKIL